jgi:hypothetical protein
MLAEIGVEVFVGGQFEKFVLDRRIGHLALMRPQKN